MEDEFERELTQLSHKLTNESETALFWQQKHSALNQTYLKADTELKLLRQDLSTSHSQQQAQQREERERDIKTRISSLMLDRDAFREAYNEAMGELRGKEEQVKELMTQVRGLKAFVSVSGKGIEQVADEAFGERWQRLGNGLQNWVITNFRRVKIGRFLGLLLSHLSLHVECVVAGDTLMWPGPNLWSITSSCVVYLLRLIYGSLVYTKLTSERPRKGRRREERRALAPCTDIRNISLIIQNPSHSITSITSTR